MSYVDLDATFVSGRSGIDTGANVCTGLGGLMQLTNNWGGLIGAPSGGWNIYIRGKADTRKVVKCNVTVNKTLWQAGDVVANWTENGKSIGESWAGRIIHRAPSSIRAELTISGNNADVDPADGIWNSSRGDSITAAQFTSKENLGFEFNSVDGSTVSGLNALIGVNSNWVNDGSKESLAIFDGNDASPCVTWLRAHSRWRFENLRCTQSSGHGFNQGGYSGATHIRYVHCKADNNATDGFNLYTFANGVMYRCIARSNGDQGFADVAGTCSIVQCVAADNIGVGCYLYPRGRIVNSLFYGNAGGIYIYGTGGSTTPVVIYGNVIEGNTSNGGITMTNTVPSQLVIVGNRITNNTGYGISVPATFFKVFEDWNVFYNNSSGARSSTIIAGDNSVAAAATKYVDSANDNYNVRPDGDVFLEPFLLDWDL